MNKRKIKIPIIIDTDPGHDDALAIMLLEKSGVADIKAVTTVAGNSTIQNVTNNARYILDLLGVSTPLFSGSSKPIKRKLVQAVVHGKSGLDGAKIKKREKLTGDAVEKIISIVRENPREISIVAIGPETNLAKAFIRDPKLPSLIKQLVIMGGAISAPGNKNRVAEFNVFVDPEAADIVFKTAVKKVLIPLDVCNDIVLRKTDFEKLKKTLLTESVLRMMDKYIYGLSVNEKANGALMYDPLAAYYLINPSAYKLQPMDIRIETAGEITRGMTVVERRTWAQKNPNVLVATKIDGGVFKKDFLRTLQ
ncbi:nucleoside hydrolase [Patescibacteria group bacterium]|jgi:inosine-uridine nucleoside N-ribohydrolase|nr:nucleoside hydrolase [Patescibacteria group bacterium]MCL5114626.1 nucleoside hydrolase [Patescibacteria group bacterium]